MLKKLKTKHLLIIAFVAVLLGLLGFRVFEAVESESQQAGGGGGMRMPTVQTGVSSRGQMNEKIALTGALKAKEQVDVMPKLTGRITRIAVDTGQAVQRGGLIAVIDDAELGQQVERAKASIAVGEAAVSQREAELKNARAELDRNKQLMDAGLVSRQQFEEVQTRYRVAQSQLELALAQRRQSEAEQRELNIRHGQTRVYAPMSGFIAKRHVDVGAMANPSTAIVTVVNLSTMVINANAAERDIARIKPGTTAVVTLDSLPGQQFQGRVMRISPLLDPQTRNGVVEIEIQNRGGVLKGEMFARAELDLGTTRETTFVPRDALVYRGDQPGVYLLEGDTARFRPVETGLTQEDRVEVINGLKEGETVITRGANLVKEGDRVRVMEARNE
ncbi:MAG TPA: efflux RND transporter periplasmic adaptor subunit [Blastocatellia bacterium]|nr:efflux RND transporter periplasmic adaptor subunit [Blastocatellia bacterium]